MGFGDSITNQTISLVARDVARFELHDIRTVLVSTREFTWDELLDEWQWGRLYGAELVVNALREKGSWALVPAFYQRGWLSAEALDALDEDGVEYELNRDVHDEADTAGDGSGNPEGALRDQAKAAPVLEEGRDDTGGSQSALAKLSMRDRVRHWHQSWRELPPAIRVGIVVPIAAALIGAAATIIAAYIGRGPNVSGVREIESARDQADEIREVGATQSPKAQATDVVGNTPTAEADTLSAESPSRVTAGSATPSQERVFAERGTLAIAISEIMFVPQAPGGNLNLESWNEYVELYNYGDEAIDVGGWWIADGGSGGNPDQLVAWTERLRNIPVGYGRIDTTVIPSGGYALILSPRYDQGDRPYDEFVTDETIILTLSDDPDTTSELIGKDGLRGREEPLDVLVLYVGTKDAISEAVSTYGTPTWNEDGKPESIRDDGLDLIPRGVTGDWGGFRRLHLDGDDTFSNWVRITWLDMSPGFEYSEQSSDGS